MTNAELQSFATSLVESTRDYIYIRPQDGLFILRPNRVHHLNPTAVAMLTRLYDSASPPNVEDLVSEVAAQYSVEPQRVRDDMEKLLVTVSALLQDKVCGAPQVRQTAFGSHKRDLPVLSEIALTYRCQNRCVFCYAEAPNRGATVGEMTTEQVKTIIDRIFDEAHCPTVSFTGGEPTLREDLPGLVAYAKAKGMRVNLITNGLRSADASYVETLRGAGLDSAQVSLEGPSAAVHDAVVQRPGAFELTTRAVHTLRAAGIHTHTNTTICGSNREHVLDLVDYIAEELKSEYFSMNVIISTGTALSHSQEDVRYSEIGAIIEQVQQRAKDKGTKLVWYSPVPYCLFNPITHDLGSKSCACVDGLLSVSPSGELLPCSSFERGIGNLLDKPFQELWFSSEARYWRNKQFLPPACRDCEMKHICSGACPLYWDAHGSFDEIPRTASLQRANTLLWKTKRRLWGKACGVGLSSGSHV
jgi:radical SAM protein with 4Fe4S-binding SPASM domain